MTVTGSKRRKVAHEAVNDEASQANSSRRAQKAFFKQASSWDLEQSYESRPRKGKKKEKESTKLPIKTADGRLEILRGLDEDGEDAESVESDTEWLEGREDDDDEMEFEPEEAEPEQPIIPESQRILQAQEELARLAFSINENPEENIASLKTIVEFGKSDLPTIQMLSLMTQMSVYKDIIPGYRIRPQEEEPSKEKLSKEVRGTRQFEQALVSGYQNYIKELARCAKQETKPFRGGQSLSSVAITCACTLTTSVPHFNFRTDLLKILIGKLSRRNPGPDANKCLQALETLFREDEEGRPSLDAISILSKMMKSREYEIDQSVLNVFLSLRVLSEFAGKASQNTVEQDMADRPRKFKKEFRTKRLRKSMKEQKALDKDMANADALVSHEERERMQSETLKLVFATYFRILKQRSPHLMGAVLEGLAKYAHLINQDFFGDLLEALKDLIRHSEEDGDDNAEEEEEATEEADNDEHDETDNMRNVTREALLCTVTAFALLEGQDAHNSRNDLHLDLSFFTTHLYTSLLRLSIHPNLELTRPTNITSATSRINVQTTTVLLLRSLTAILLPPWNIRSVPPLRLAAFSKQLMSTALQLPDKSCQAVLVLLNDIAHTHGKKINSMWNTEERKGDGRFRPMSDSVEGSNPFAATVWEGELLKKHFSPKVREGVKLLEKGLSK